MNIDFKLKEYYKKYLKEIRNVKESSVKHYIGAINTISKYLVEKEKIKQSVYEIIDLEEILSLRDYLYQDKDFIEKDIKGNRMYSVGLNHYCRFVSGEGFDKLKESMYLLDTVIPIQEKITAQTKQYKRSSIIKKQSIEAADYMCELNNAHTTFISASTKHQYMEGHHAIPLMKQDLFCNSLDVYANIVCLCPICHR